MQTLRCTECSADILKTLAWNNWLKMVNFIEFLEKNGAITGELASDMFECMMSFKGYAEDENERQEKEFNKEV